MMNKVKDEREAINRMVATWTGIALAVFVVGLLTA